jgi:hypothetical protein
MNALNLPEVLDRFDGNAARMFVFLIYAIFVVIEKALSLMGAFASKFLWRS